MIRTAVLVICITVLNDTNSCVSDMHNRVKRYEQLC